VNGEQVVVADDLVDLFEHAPCGYVSAAPDGSIVRVNETFVAWTGLDRAALVGRRFHQLLAPGDRIFYETHFAPLLRMQGHVREIAVELVGADGGRLPVLVNAVLVYDDAGEPVAIRAVVFDATERRAYEQELIAARRRAEASEATATTLARTLQSTFLPPVMPTVPGVDLGGAYRPAGDGSIVGGDFYDVFETAPGSWAILLGDVAGKGPEAAVLTALVRHTARAEALHRTSPGEVLGAVHEALVHYQPDQLCTALFLTVEGGDVVRLRIAAGGHLPPVVRRADGSFAAAGDTGRILGVLEHPRIAERTLELAPGDVVVLLTDGVTEARGGGELFGDDRVRVAVDDAAAMPAQAIADALVATALDFQAGDARDDIAVLVLKAPAAP
jgi:sigma-B regulation protein RsbU (phosphoserine phosphatase)